MQPSSCASTYSPFLSSSAGGSPTAVKRMRGTEDVPAAETCARDDCFAKKSLMLSCESREDASLAEYMSCVIKDHDAFAKEYDSEGKFAAEFAKNTATIASVHKAFIAERKYDNDTFVLNMHQANNAAVLAQLLAFVNAHGMTSNIGHAIADNAERMLRLLEDKKAAEKEHAVDYLAFFAAALALCTKTCTDARGTRDLIERPAEGKQSLDIATLVMSDAQKDAEASTMEYRTALTAYHLHEVLKDASELTCGWGLRGKGLVALKLERGSACGCECVECICDV